jgi:aminoglycoside phosphotransferase (APT) family kinase protein
MASPSEPASISERLQAVLEPVLGAVAIDDLRRLSGGASRETWSFAANGRALILRRDPPGRPGLPGSMRLEADAMRACRRAGLAAPDVLVDDDGAVLGTAGLVMAHVDGETLARKILRDDEYANARAHLVDDLGRFLAGLHAIDPAEVPSAADTDSVTASWHVYEQLDDTSPTFDKSYEWMVANRPARTATTIVHGDLRLGNIIVDDNGLAAAIDWELVHVGDPLEDLAWLCVKAWRFGAPLEVGGLGTIDQLVAAYEGAGGRTVDRDALHWWLVAKTLWWGIGCMGQAAVHLSGAVRSHELAAIGRRVAEEEWDLIELLAPVEWQVAREAPLPEPVPDIPGLYGRPTAREILDAVRRYLTDDVMPATTGRLSFHARVAANMLAIVERELAQQELPYAGNDWASLADAVRLKLAVANPKHLRG